MPRDDYRNDLRRQIMLALVNEDQASTADDLLDHVLQRWWNAQRKDVLEELNYLAAAGLVALGSRFRNGLAVWSLTLDGKRYADAVRLAVDADQREILHGV